MKLILTKPPGNEWSAYATVFVTDAYAPLREEGHDSPTASVLTYRANVKPLLETLPLQRWNYPCAGTIA